MNTTSPTGTRSLADAARVHIGRANTAAAGRSAQTLRGGHERALRQTVVALRAGTTLHEHESTREATIQVLVGSVRVNDGAQDIQAVAGDLLTVPGAAHTLSATEDSALLLTVALVLPAHRPVAGRADVGPMYSWLDDWDQG